MKRTLTEDALDRLLSDVSLEPENGVEMGSKDLDDLFTDLVHVVKHKDGTVQLKALEILLRISSKVQNKVFIGSIGLRIIPFLVPVAFTTDNNLSADSSVQNRIYGLKLLRTLAAAIEDKESLCTSDPVLMLTVVENVGEGSVVEARVLALHTLHHLCLSNTGINYVLEKKGFLQCLFDIAKTFQNQKEAHRVNGLIELLLLYYLFLFTIFSRFNRMGPRIK